MIFKVGRNLGKLVVHLRHLLFQMADWGRRANAGHNVFALRVDQVFPEQRLFAGCGVAGKCHARSGMVAGIAEGHLLHVDRGAPLVRDLIHLAVNIRAGIVPRAEHGLHGLNQLLLRVLRERLMLIVLIDLLENANQFFQIVGRQVDIVLDSLFRLHLVNFVFKEALGNTHDDIREHLNKAAVAVVSETWVVGLFRQTLNGFVVQTQVQDRVHHAWHRLARAGTDGDQQRVVDVAKRFPGDFFQALHMFKNIILNFLVDLTAVRVILSAGIRRNGKALWHRHSGSGHFCEAGALAT